MTEKIFVLDSNEIFTDWQVYDKLGDNIVVIPAVVKSEADKKKKRPDDVGYHARKFISLLEEKSRDQNIVVEGFPTSGGGRLHVSFKYTLDQGKDPLRFISEIGENDKNIVRCAGVWQAHNPNHHVELITKDKNVLLMARENGINASTRRDDDIDLSAVPSMRLDLVDSDLVSLIQKEMTTKQQRISLTAELMIDHDIDLETFPHNKYVVVKNYEDESGVPNSRMFRYNIVTNCLEPLTIDMRIPIAGVRPRNIEQTLLFDACLNDDNYVVVGEGPAGTGKTLCMLSAALHKIWMKREQLNDEEAVLYLTKPTSNVGGEDYGFMPGDLNAKVILNYRGMSKNIRKILSWWQHTEMTPEGELVMKRQGAPDYMRDDWGKNLIELQENGIVEVYPIGYVRGDSIMPNEILLLDEAQNTLPNVMRAIATRIEDGSLLLISGDPYNQFDNPLARPEYNGLSAIISDISQRHDPKFNFNAAVKLTKSERGRVSEFYYNRLKN